MHAPLLQVYARSHAEVAAHASFGPVKALAAAWGGLVDNSTALFGENMTAVHSIKYDRLDSNFYLFGVYNCSKEVSQAHTWAWQWLHIWFKQ